MLSVPSFRTYDFCSPWEELSTARPAPAANYTAEVEELKGQDPDAIVLIAFDETKKIVPELIKAGIGQNG